MIVLQRELKLLHFSDLDPNRPIMRGQDRLCVSGATMLPRYYQFPHKSASGARDPSARKPKPLPRPTQRFMRALPDRCRCAGQRGPDRNRGMLRLPPGPPRAMPQTVGHDRSSQLLRLRHAPAIAAFSLSGHRDADRRPTRATSVLGSRSLTADLHGNLAITQFPLRHRIDVELGRQTARFRPNP